MKTWLEFLPFCDKLVALYTILQHCVYNSVLLFGCGSSVFSLDCESQQCCHLLVIKHANLDNVLCPGALVPDIAVLLVDCLLCVIV